MIDKRRISFSGTIAKAAAHPLTGLLLVAAVGIAAYANTFHVPFFFDDERSITDNPVIWDMGRLLRGEGHDFNPRVYNPRRFVSYLTLALNYRVGGLDVIGYHIFNLTVHIAASWLVFALARLTMQTSFFGTRNSGLGTRDSGLGTLSFVPLLASLLFVAHPVQTEAVTYIVQRDASLATMFFLGAVAAYARARLLYEDKATGPALAYGLLCATLGLLAAGTKEIAVTLPLVLVAYEQTFFPGRLRKKFVGVIGATAFIMAAAAVALTMAGIRPGHLLAEIDRLTRETTAISRSDYLSTQFAVIATYLRLLVLPFRQNLDYDYPVYHSFLAPRVFFSFLLLFSLAAAALFFYVRTRSGRPDQGMRLAGFGIIWFFVTLSVESSIIPIRDVIFEHRLYLPSVGAFLAVASLALAACRRLPTRAVAATATAVVVVLAGTTYTRNSVWSDEIGFWKDVCAKSPAKGRPHHNLALAYRRNGMFREAESAYLEAIRLDPAFSDSYANLGVIYRKEGRIREAIAMDLRAIELGSDNPGAWLNLGVLDASQGNFSDAEKQFREALRLAPRYADAHYNLGLLFNSEGHPDKAELEYRETIAIDPRYDKAFHDLGKLCAVSGRRSEAEADLRKAVTLVPDNPLYAADLRTFLLTTVR